MKNNYDAKNPNRIFFEVNSNGSPNMKSTPSFENNSYKIIE